LIAKILFRAAAAKDAAVDKAPAILLIASLAFGGIAGKKHMDALHLIDELNKRPAPQSFAVMITNQEGNSGGSGSVIQTDESESLILTNSHVCEHVLKKGGKVSGPDGSEHNVTGYYLSDEHDLCALTVAYEYGDKARLASHRPREFEPVTIVGHPALFPTIITRGHFSGKKIIQIMTGIKECTEADLADENKAFLCAFLGGIPIFKDYESQVVSATILPGSSGSAVLDDKGDIAGVAFASDSRELSYAFIVTYEAVRNFIQKELPRKIAEGKSRPWTNPQEPDKQADLFKKAKEACSLLGVMSNKIPPAARKAVVEFCQQARDED
jgi:hypothetical protein